MPNMFLDNIVVMMLPQNSWKAGRVCWQLVQPFSYYTYLAPPKSSYVSGVWSAVVDNKPAYQLVVPSGFITDFASVPRCFWPLIGPVGIHARAALVHDYLVFFKVGSARWAADVFLEAMKVSGVGIIKRTLIYWAVRLFGPSYKG